MGAEWGCGLIRLRNKRSKIKITLIKEQGGVINYHIIKSKAHFSNLTNALVLESIKAFVTKVAKVFLEFF